MKWFGFLFWRGREGGKGHVTAMTCEGVDVVQALMSVLHEIIEDDGVKAMACRQMQVIRWDEFDYEVDADAYLERVERHIPRVKR